MADTTAGGRFPTLVALMRRLREPGGCPWDREQTFESLKPYLIEEAYEVLEAIDTAQGDTLREELGDLLLQFVFLARLAEERGWFTADDVIEGICDKMVRRHPHVFGTAQVDTAREVLARWHDMKRQERAAEWVTSALDGVPATLPALLRAHRLTERAAHVGFDWETVPQVIAKVHEELREFDEATAAHDRLRQEEELGDLLFALANLARFVDLNPEEALRKAIERFVARFHHIERTLAARGRSASEATLAEMDALWAEAKGREKAAPRAES